MRVTYKILLFAALFLPLLTHAEQDKEVFITCRRALTAVNSEHTDSQGNTDLHRAILLADQDRMTQLIHEGASLAAKNNRDLTPLDLALNSKEYGVLISFLQAFLEYAEPFNTDLNSRKTEVPIHLLLKRIPSMRVQGVYGGSLLSTLIRWWGKLHDDFELQELLSYLSNQTDKLFLYETDQQGNSALVHLVQVADVEKMKILLELGLDPRFAATGGISAEQVAKQLLDQARANAKEFSGRGDTSFRSLSIHQPQALEAMHENFAQLQLRQSVWDLLSEYTPKKPDTEHNRTKLH